MHLGGAGIGEADVNAARNQRPHQTFRTIHRSAPLSRRFLILIEDQSFLAHFVKGFGNNAAIARGAVCVHSQFIETCAVSIPAMVLFR
jgi:hypothetical protein